jgi:myo-inositol 2-dehydrogenase/D-chiro-inositol 1-dehydrogenase
VKTLAFASLEEAIRHYGVRSKEYFVKSKKYDCPEDDVTSVSSESSTEDKNSHGIDGIVLCGPTFVHDKVIREAAEHGLFIFTEKPVDETAEKIQNLFQFCEEKGVSLCCGFQRRFDDSYTSAAERVKNGCIGRPVSAQIIFADNPTPPMEFLLTGGNIFMDLSAHDIDYIRWVLGDEVVSVYANGSSSMKELEDAGVHDNATMVMNFKQGTVVTLTMSRRALYGYDQRCEIFGTNGHVMVANEHTNSAIFSDENGIHRSKYKHSFPQRFHQAFTSELDAYADTILNGSEWPVTAIDCISVQKVADAARKANETNSVVYL